MKIRTFLIGSLLLAATTSAQSKPDMFSLNPEEKLQIAVHNRILALIDRLPDREREAILLSAVDELTTAEIAAALGTTESSIRSRIFRARRELAVLLEKEGIPR